MLQNVILKKHILIKADTSDDASKEEQEKALEKALLNKMPISYDAIVLAKEFNIKISIKNRENSLLCIIK